MEQTEKICVGYWVCKLRSGPCASQVYAMHTGLTPQYHQLCLRDMLSRSQSIVDLAGIVRTLAP